MKTEEINEIENDLISKISDLKKICRKLETVKMSDSTVSFLLSAVGDIENALNHTYEFRPKNELPF